MKLLWFFSFFFFHSFVRLTHKQTPHLTRLSLNEYMNAGIESAKKTDETTSTQDHAQPIGASTSTKSTLYSTTLPPSPSPSPPTTDLLNSKNEQIGSNYSHANESDGLNAASIVSAQCDDATGTATITTESAHIRADDSLEHRSMLDPPSYEESQNMLKLGNSNTSATELTESVTADSDSQTTTGSGSDEMDSESDEDDDTGDDQYATDTGNDERMNNDSPTNRTELSSSVIPPTSISLEITESHDTETDTALPGTANNSKSSEIFENNVQINHVEHEMAETADEKKDAAQLVSAQVVVSCPTVNEPEQSSKPLNRHADDGEQTDEKMVIDTPAMLNERFIKPIPITFETAATMDDVSDTELESYLQELEDLEDGNSMAAATPASAAIKMQRSDSIKSANGSLKIDENDTEPYDGIDNIIGSASDINQMVARDDRNADSFSQASTVEFGEVNATNSSNEQLPCPEQIVVPVSTDAAETATVGVADATDPEPTVEMNNERSHETMQSHQNHSNHENAGIEATASTEIGEHSEAAQRQECLSDGSGQPQIECPECEIDQQIMGTVKRPNSLNLQNCNSTLVAAATAAAASQSDQTASSSLLNFSSDDNAGNTPPASGMFLSSSMSSDDSNIGPTDNDRLMVSVKFVSCWLNMFHLLIFFYFFFAFL